MTLLAKGRLLEPLTPLYTTLWSRIPTHNFCILFSLGTYGGTKGQTDGIQGCLHHRNRRWRTWVKYNEIYSGHLVYFILLNPQNTCLVSWSLLILHLDFLTYNFTEVIIHNVIRRLLKPLETPVCKTLVFFGKNIN